VLQQMRSARFVLVVWSLIAIAFVGGFLLVDSSGLLGLSGITPTTAVAEVNGREILYQEFLRRSQEEVNAAQQRAGRTLTQDESRQIENSTFDQMVMDVLLQQEFDRRGITVTEQELREYARFAPPPALRQAPDLMTEGQFDLAKYQRYIASPQARQSGLLLYLEQYYRAEVPKQKLYDQVSSGIYVPDTELWRIWQDQHDSAQVSYVAYHPRPDTTAARTIPESALREYFDKHKNDFRRTGRAVVSLVIIPRVITAADSAATRARALALRNEILGGAKFEDVAKRESIDTISGPNGGDLGRSPLTAYVPDFANAARALRVGDVSQPVLTPYGYHLIRVDERKGDTAKVRHILLRIQASDSATTRIDRRADSLANIAANAELGSRLDSASKVLGLQIEHVQAFENQPAVLRNRLIPSVSAWAFGGARPGEVSELFDDENGYYIARLDSLIQGGEPTLENVRNDVAVEVAAQRQLDSLQARAAELATAARSSSLETASQSQQLTVEKTSTFTRGTLVPGLGQFNEAIGASFGLPVGQISNPVRTEGAVFVLRVDRRVKADTAAFEAQKEVLRQQRTNQLRDQRVQMFLQDLRESAKIEDRRKELNAIARRQQA
jgi:peptidyl-prolyl cis-trans isomerase D